MPNAQALLNLFPLPNATDPTGTNQYNYVFQTVQDWPRNDQVLRVDWNISPNTTAYGRLQWGYEKRSGGVSLLGSIGGWPQMATKYEIDTVSYVNTRAAHVQPDAVRRVHGRRELGAPEHEPVRRRRARCQRPPGRAARHAAVLPGGESAVHPSAGHVHRRRPPGNRSRRSASSSGSRSSATTRCSTSPGTSRS